MEQITQEEDQILITTPSAFFRAQKVVSTIPPRLLLQKIAFRPALPQELVEIGNTTHTWMGESIKVGLTFAHPFWRQSNSSGTIFSNVGPISEFYDHSNAEDDHYALKGFMNGAFHSATKDQRLELILKQLRKYYGQQVDEYLDYQERVWAKEPLTYVPYDGYILPHQNNGNAIFRQSFWDGQLWIAGSETAAQFPGYMDGAVESAEMISQLVS